MTLPLLAAAVAVALLGCSAPMAPTASGPDADVAVAEVSAALDDALAAAKSYGMKQLGHYLELDAEALVAEGFTAAEGVVLAAHPTHAGICLAAEHAGVPRDHEWRVASIDSRRQQPTAGNTCDPGVAPAEVALQTPAATAGGALVCLIPAEPTEALASSTTTLD